MSDPAPGSDVPPQGKTRLIVKPNDLQRNSANREESVRSAMTRALAEYLEQLTTDLEGGRRLRFKSVRKVWAAPDQNAKFPAVAIHTEGDGVYDASSFTPTLNPKERLPAPDNRYFVMMCEYVQDVQVEIWGNDIPERAGLVYMLETAFNPVTWRYGFVLEMPFYFNPRAVFELKSMRQNDSDDTAVKRYRNAVMTLNVRAPLCQLLPFPDAVPRFEMAAIGTGSDVLLSSPESL